MTLTKLWQCLRFSLIPSNKQVYMWALWPCRCVPTSHHPLAFCTWKTCDELRECWKKISSCECCKRYSTFLQVVATLDICILVVCQVEVDDGHNIFFTFLVLFEHFDVRIGWWSASKCFWSCLVYLYLLEVNKTWDDNTQTYIHMHKDIWTMFDVRWSYDLFALIFFK